MNQKVIRVIESIAKKNNLKIDFNNYELTLKESGIDSLALLNLIFKVENELNIRIPDEKLIEIKKLGDLLKIFSNIYESNK